MNLKKSLLFISIALIFLQPLFSGGGKEAVPGSNFAVTGSAIDIPEGKRIFYASIAEGKLYVNFYDHKEKTERTGGQEDGQNNEKKPAKKTGPRPNSSPKIITEISGGEFKIHLINDTLMVYDRPNIYRYTISIKNTEEENGIEIDSQSISEKASSCLFYDNHCFFVETDGTVGSYNFTDGKKNIFSGVKIDQVNIALMIIKKDLFLKTISPLSDEWFENITFENISKDGFTMTAADKDNMRRRLMIKRQESQPKEGYDSIDSWLSYLKDEYNEIENKKENIEKEKDALKDEFDNQLRGFDKHIALETAAAYKYGGADSDIAYLTGFYNKIIEAYAILKQKNILSLDSERLLQGNHAVIKKELSALITAKRENYEKNIERLDAQLAQLNEDMEGIFQKSFDRINADSIPAKDNFDFVYLKNANGHTDYVIIYKVLTRPSPAGEFTRIGQNTGNMGFFNESIYVCDTGGINVYDPFSLKLKASPGNMIDPGGRETILYSINSNDALVVTKTEKKNAIFYRVREIDFNKETVALKDPKIKVLGNKSNKLAKWAEPFYSVIISDENDKTLYINERKNKAGERIIIKEDYIYLETLNGSGIITRKETKE
jgi:hypothetical protein